MSILSTRPPYSRMNQWKQNDSRKKSNFQCWMSIRLLIDYNRFSFERNQWKSIRIIACDYFDMRKSLIEWADIADVIEVAKENRQRSGYLDGSSHWKVQRIGRTVLAHLRSWRFLIILHNFFTPRFPVQNVSQLVEPIYSWPKEDLEFQSNVDWSPSLTILFYIDLSHRSVLDLSRLEPLLVPRCRREPCSLCIFLQSALRLSR